MKKREAGVTVLEIMLVLVIAGLIIVMSIRQYQSYRYHADVRQIESSIDKLFQAMFLYYKAQCSKGTLAPPNLNSPHVININDDLKNFGYLEDNLAKSPIVNAKSGTEGYFAQFNLKTEPREICLTEACGAGEKKEIGTIVIWKPQISLNLTKPELAGTYKNLLDATCMSDSPDQCGPDAKKAGYLIFERMPVNANFRARSSYWGLNPTVDQFKQMYTTRTVGELLNKNNKETQYFVCGG